MYTKRAREQRAIHIIQLKRASEERSSGLAGNSESYSDPYKMSVRAIWYSNGCPSIKKLIEMNIIPPDEQGRIVNAYQIKHWFDDEQWIQWRDVINAELSVQIEKRLMTERMKLVKEQLDQSGKIRRKAFAEIEEKGFDSSASAVNAFFKSMEEERGLMQIDKMIAELTEKDTATIQREFKELAERAGITIIDAEETTMEEGVQHAE